MCCAKCTPTEHSNQMLLNQYITFQMLRAHQFFEETGGLLVNLRTQSPRSSWSAPRNEFIRKYFILWDIVNPQLGSGLGSGLGLGFGLDSVRGSTISHKMKYFEVLLSFLGADQEERGFWVRDWLHWTIYIYLIDSIV